MQFRPVNVGRVATWEFFKAIKSPMFIIMTVFFPLLIGSLGGIGFFTDRLVSEDVDRVAVIDETEAFYPYLEKHAEGQTLELVLYRGTREELTREVRDATFDAFTVVSEGALEAGRLPFYARDPRDVNSSLFRRVASSAAGEYRLAALDLPIVEVQWATAPLVLDTRTIEEGREINVLEIFVPFAFMIVLIMAIVFSGQVLMYGVIKEKRNRIVEILLSSVSSLDLMVGKIAGYGTLSLIQLAIWVGAGLIIGNWLLDLQELNLTVGDFALPLVFFIFGYIMIASLFAALGSTMKEAEEGSQAQGLVILVPMVPLFISGIIATAPNTPWIRVMTHIPPFTPAMVLMRMGFTTIPAWEVGTILVALLVSTGLFIFIGARIFEKGILQYETISLREIRGMISGR